MSEFFKIMPFYALLSLSCMNFLGRGPVFFFISMIIGIILMSRKYCARYYLSVKDFLPFLLLTIITCLSSFLNFEIKDTIKTFNFFLAYYVGASIYNKSTDGDDVTKKVIICSVIGFLTNMFLIYYINMIVMNHENGVRNLYDFWTSEYTPGTLVGLLSAAPIALSYYLIVFSEKRIFKIIGILFAVFIFIINNATATRTPFVLFVLVFFIMTLCTMKENRVRTLLTSFIVLSVALLFYEFNILNINDLISNSAIIERFNEDSTSTSRVDVTLYYFDILFDYPFGGKNGMEIIGFEPHNFIQGLQFFYGIIPFILCLIIAYKIITILYRFYKVSNKSKMDILLMTTLLAVFAQCLLEPVYTGYPQLLWFLFLLAGVGEMRLQDINFISDYTSVLNVV